MSAEWRKVDEAEHMTGLRLVLTQGVPNPWAEAAKAGFEGKRIPYTRVIQRVMAPNAELQRWTGQTSAPVAAWNDERPRTTWSEIVQLAERLQPEPALMPADPEQRALHFGLLHEIAGEMGLGWCRRMNFANRFLSGEETPLRAVAEYVGGRYGYGWADQAVVRRRIVELLTMFSARLRRQYDAGHPFLLGDRLTAADLYWATFTALIRPLPEEQCAMHPMSRSLYTLEDDDLLRHAQPILFQHRDRIYRDHLTLPVQL